MKISINLYDDELRPKKHLLTLNNIAIVSMIGLVSMLAWFGSLSIVANKTLAKQSMVAQQKAFAEQELTTLQQAIIKHNDSAPLNAKKENLERKMQAKKALLSLVENRNDEEAVNYYQVMKELTEHHDHDVWLEHFVFNKNDVAFNGFATKSSAVTQWLTYLQATESFKGREFSQLNITSADEENLSFSTATSIAVSQAGEEQ